MSNSLPPESGAVKTATPTKDDRRTDTRAAAALDAWVQCAPSGPFPRHREWSPGNGVTTSVTASEDHMGVRTCYIADTIQTLADKLRPGWWTVDDSEVSP